MKTNEAVVKMMQPKQDEESIASMMKKLGAADRQTAIELFQAV